MSKRSSSHEASRRIALCGMAVALSVTLMLTSSIIPVMTYAAPMLGGLLLIPVELEYDRRTAYITFLATALLTMVLGFNKELALFYLFFGCYPVLKWRIERVRGSKYLRFGLKILYFTVALALMYLGLILLMGAAAVLSEFQELGIFMTAGFFLLMILCLMLFDHLLTPVTLLYVTRFQSRVKKLLK